MQRLGDLATLCGAELRGEPDMVITGIATLGSAGSGEIAFLANPKYRAYLADTRASAVIIDAESADGWDGPALITPNPYLAYARVAAAFETRQVPSPGIADTACVADSAVIDETAAVGPGVVIAANVRIGPKVEVGANCVIGENSRLGPETRLAANVTVYHGVIIGARCLVHSGAVIGADGFGQAPDGEGRWEKVPQLGGVRIGDDVEIGANTTIDRGALDDTVIEDGVKLDNQIQIAHNVHIGAHTVMAGAAGVSGSTRIGRHCMIGGGAAFAGHLEIVDGVTVLAMSFVTHSLKEKGTYAGVHPIDDVRSWRKNSARLRNLDELARRVKALEKQLSDKGKQGNE
ncbi:MAG: UDP-3-O-(3-hydroxymyristoyl)glucosamine N-acyltransferase [Gammaproteobacteria bacterium]|nr:UDP-3-O-(3-hydroxymyristoyl)glucosamine N-acyltransferase [Gammaproteobacteria bacterium]